jgi:uncharacterized protein
MNSRIQEIIDSLGLEPHPEGGYYKEIYRSEQEVESPALRGTRNAITNIYFMLTQGQVSRFHKVSHDEIWHFLEGDTLELIELKRDTLEVNHEVLGAKTGKPHYQHTIKAENWQAARCMGSYSLVGCTVAPGFDFKDFIFLSQYPDVLQKVMLEKSELIPLI